MNIINYNRQSQKFVSVEADDMWTHCGPSIFTDDTGVVASPLYPRDYPPRVLCQWLIQVEQGKTISLE